MARRHALAIAVAALVFCVPATAASALTSRPCKNAGGPGFRCATVTVPLDRTGAVPGTVKLRIAFQRSRPGRRGALMALSGGPGQPSIDFAESFRQSLLPALRHRRLVLVDQRGTGRTGALVCGRLQAEGSLDEVVPRVVGDCGGSLGPARNRYTTADNVQDLDAVRAALGIPRMALMGISYGTYTAVQYARTYPERTERLILDSVVPPGGLDPYLLDSFKAFPRILREQCGRRGCRLATKDPLGDVERLAARLRRGPIRGVRFGPGGVARVEQVADESELALLVMSGDINPFLQPALPGAINAALDGDTAPLMRARWLANGGPATPQEFSGALNVATNCTDTTMPYSYAMPAADRREGWRHGLDGVADSVFAPFSREGVLQTALAHDCLLWPGDPAPAANSTAPVPDVPAIVLTGRLDTRTPVESARRTAALFPRGTVVEVPGTGHDILDSDITGCAFKALGRWVAGRPVGRPCRGQSNQVPPYARSPRHLRQFRSAPGVGGPRGRVVFATLDTVADAQVTALETLYAGFLRLRGGGLRGGSFDAPDTLDSIRLDDYALVQGVEVTGRLSILDGGATTGSVRVDGPGRLDGRLRLDRRGGVRGTLAGRAVRYRPKRAGAAAVGSGRAPRSVAALWPSARALARAAARSRGSAAPRP